MIRNSFVFRKPVKPVRYLKHIFEDHGHPHGPEDSRREMFDILRSSEDTNVQATSNSFPLRLARLSYLACESVSGYGKTHG